MDAIFRNLTQPQRDAVAHREGPLLILAGPGSGKTRVVTHRVANLVSSGVPARQIAALTFTNKAAEEMRSRVDALVPGQPVWMGTFHRFCAQLLRRYGPLVGLSQNYSIYDSSDAKAAIKRAITAAGVSTSHYTPEQIATSISHAKNRLVTPEMMQGHALSPRDEIAARVYPVYRQQLLLANAADFDDLLFHVGLLLRENPELRAELDAKFAYIMVDEYQDTNLAQYAIVRALSIDQPNLAVTGDPDQSIYGWRGADLNNILDFEKDYPSVKTVRLEQNYRSTPNVLRVADQLIRHNRRRKAKALFTENPEGDPVVLRFYNNGYAEADDIADQIVRAIHDEGLCPSDFAVFCRMNALTRSLEHAFRSRGLPYQIVNGLEFYQRREIKDLLAYLHLINNPSHDVAFLRVVNVPTRGIGTKTIERIRQHADSAGLPLLEAARHAARIESIPKRSVSMVMKFVELFDHLSQHADQPLGTLLPLILKVTDYEAYLERTSDEDRDVSPMANVDELISAAVEFDRQHPDDGSLETFLEQVALIADTDAFEESSERVTLMTLHASKGLEFTRVFIIGVEDGLLPHNRSKESAWEIEEERRLLFVGITRAKQGLQLSCCNSRAVRGDLVPAIPSPFLNEMPLEEMRRIDSGRELSCFESSDEQGYPDSWDLPDYVDESDAVDEPSCVDEPPMDEPPMDEPPMDDRVREASATSTAVKVAELRTAADMLARQTIPLSVYQEGMRVRHAEYGEGVILAVSGRGPKRIARIQFHDGEHRFRLAFVDLELVSSQA